MKNLTMVVGEALGVFVHISGAKVIANQGAVTVEAQNSTMSLTSRKQFTITSTEDEIILSTPKTLMLNGGGSYLKLSQNGIEHGSAGDFIVKAAQYLVPGTGAIMPQDKKEMTEADLAVKPGRTGKGFSG
ncbi:DUF2345 domain-containing protein [Salmonella enterica]|nr:DUF2345 domain-containing protein [Salmonella enterica]